MSYIKPNKFEYAFSNTNENKSGIYMLEKNKNNSFASSLNTSGDVISADNYNYIIPDGTGYKIYDNSDDDINQ
jgi:hypothetical protein